MPRLHALLTHPDVRRYLMDDLIVEREWVFDVVESSRKTFAEASYGLWCVESRARRRLRRPGRAAGHRRTRDEPQLLYALDPPPGIAALATEASRRRWSTTRSTSSALSELLASTDPPNHASIRVMERLGMRFLEAGRAGGPAHRVLPDRSRRLEARAAASRRPRRAALRRRRALSRRDADHRHGRRSAPIETPTSPRSRRCGARSFPPARRTTPGGAASARMVEHAPDLFFVAELDGEVVGTVLAGWDGHRGWIYSLGVRPDLQRSGIGVGASRPCRRRVSARAAAPRSTCRSSATTGRWSPSTSGTGGRSRIA